MVRNRILYWMILPGIFVSLVGCAVMTVDVDVYKGPLANHEDVQTEQMAAMAIGAKPLLIQLRNTLEDDFTLQDNVDSKSLDESQAKRVNEILTLYRDQIPEELSTFVSEGEKAIEVIKNACNTIFPSNIAKPNDVWNEIDGSLRVFDNKIKTKDVAVISKSLNVSTKTVEGLNKRLSIQEIKELAEKIIFEKQYFEELTLQDQDKLFDLLKIGRIYPKKSTFTNIEKFALLLASDEDEINDFIFIEKKTQLEQIFGKLTKKKEQHLKNQLVHLKILDRFSANPLMGLRLAYEFFIKGDNNGWRDLDRIYIAHLCLWTKLKDKGLFDELDPKYLLNDLRLHYVSANRQFKMLLTGNLVNIHANILFLEKAKVEKQIFVSRVKKIADAFLIARRNMDRLLELTLTGISTLHTKGFKPSDKVDRLHRAAASLAASIITPEQLLYALENEYPSDEVKGFRDTLIEMIGGIDEYIDLENKVSNQFFISSLKQALTDRDGTNANLLLIANRAYMQGFKDQDPIYEYKYELTSDYRRFGITTGPYNKFNIEEITEMFRNASSSSASLGGGRLVYGMESIIQKYLDAKEMYGSTHEQTIKDRRLMSDALVRFAKKILFIANNSKLLEEKNKHGKLDSYVMVLQAIGNSIIIQADELRHRASHKDRIVNAKYREALALKAAMDQDPNKVFNDIIDNIYELKSGEDKKSVDLKNELKNDGIDVSAKDIETIHTEKKRELATAESQLVSANEEFDKIVITREVLNEKELPDPILTNANVEPFSDVLENKIFVTVSPVNVVDLVKGVATLLKDEIRKDRDAHQSIPSKRSDNMTVAQSTLDGFEANELSGFSGNSAKLILKEVIQKVYDNRLAAKRDKEKVVNNFEKIAVNIEKLKKVEEYRPQLNDAYVKIKEVKPNVLKSFRISKDQTTPAAVIWQLRTVLHQKSQDSGNTDADDKSKYTIARKVLDNIVNVPMESGLAGLDNPNTKSSKDVLDLLIAELRHQHIQASRQFGVNSGPAMKVANALEVAYLYRSGMVYIRPSGAYLRSSYPSTSLQANSGGKWQNMLSRHALRSTPLVGGWFANPNKQKLETIAEIDKQFWQNINSVRVAGAGRTNYVIAKDDIGNWYVKRYSADPKDIIKTAKKLAMFNIGAGMGTDMLNRLDTKEGVPGAENIDANKSSLEKLFIKYKEDYDKRTTVDYSKLRGILLEKKHGNSATVESFIEYNVSQAWDQIQEHEFSNHLEGLKGVMKTSASVHLSSAREMLPLQPKKEDRSVHIIQALRKIKQFHKEMIDGINDKDLTKNAEDKQKEMRENLNVLKGKQEYEKKSLEELRIQHNNAEATHKQIEVDLDRLRVSGADTSDKEIELMVSRARIDDLANNINNKEGSIETIKSELIQKKDAYENAENNFISAKRGKETAKHVVTQVVRDQLMKVYESRMNTVQDYDTAVSFISEAIKE